METIKSLIKKIDKYISLRATGIALLAVFVLLILIEYIWKGSVEDLMNISVLVVLAIILAFLIAAVTLNRYLGRYLRARRISLSGLKERFTEWQAGQSETIIRVSRAVLSLLLIFPIILLTLIAVETFWEGSVSYHINLDILVISTIATEMLAILAVMVMLYRYRPGPARQKRRKPAPRPLAPEIRAERAAAGLSTAAPAPAPAEAKKGEGKRRWAGRGARSVPTVLLLIFLGAILIALAVGSIWEDSLPGQISQLRIVAVVLAVIVVWGNRGRANTGLLFIISVIFLALPQLMNVVMYFEEEPTISLHIKSFLDTFSPIAIAAGAIAGMTYMHRNRDKITAIFEKKENGENISRGRNLLYKFLPLILLMITLAVTLPRLGYFEFKGDEYQVVDAAAGYYYTGEFYKWDWLTDSPSDIYYNRAWPHTFMVAESYHLFGISEWSSRIVSVFWFIILVLSAYFVGKKIINRNFALVFAIIAAIYPTYLFWARYTRMYIVFIPVFFLAAYFLYRGLFTGKPHTKFRIIAGLKLQYLYLVLGGLLFFFSYLIHLDTLIYAIGFFVFLLLWSFNSKNRAYFKLVGIIVIAAIVLLFIMLFSHIGSSVTQFAGIPDNSNYEYTQFLFQYPFGTELTLMFCISGLPIFWRKDFLKYCFILPISALILFVFFTTRYVSWAYICNFTPFIIMLSAICLYFFTTFLFKKKPLYKFTLIFISLFIIISGFCLEAPNLYSKESAYCHFREAYQVINENYTEDEVIIGQYLRTYYINPINADNVTTVSMLNAGEWTYEEFIDTINSYDSGWITWQSNKGYHIIKDIKNYIYANFEKIHGTGVDDTGVEVYRFENK